MPGIKYFMISLHVSLCRSQNLDIAQRTQALVKMESNETFWTGIVPATGNGRCLIMSVPVVYMLHCVVDGY